MNAINQFAQMVAPGAGYQPGVSPEHLWFGPMALTAQQATAETDPAAGGTSQPAERAVEEAFGGGMADTRAGWDRNATGDIHNTSGNALGISGAMGSILGNETAGKIAGAAVPGNMASGIIGRGLREMTGPYGLVGMEEVGIGHPQWGAKLALIREMKTRNARGGIAEVNGVDFGAFKDANLGKTNRSWAGGLDDDVGAGRAKSDMENDRGRSSQGGTTAKSDMESERGRSSGAGGGGSERVICTELYRQGKLARADWKRDLAFTAEHLTAQHVRGYHWWACSVVKALRRGRWVRFWTFWANHRAAEIAYLMGERPRGDWLGKAFRWTVEPACWLIGAYVGKSDWQALYRGEAA